MHDFGPFPFLLIDGVTEGFTYIPTTHPDAPAITHLIQTTYDRTLTELTATNGHTTADSLGYVAGETWIHTLGMDNRFGCVALPELIISRVNPVEGAAVLRKIANLIIEAEEEGRAYPTEVTIGPITYQLRWLGRPPYSPALHVYYELPLAPMLQVVYPGPDGNFSTYNGPNDPPRAWQDAWWLIEAGEC